MSFWLGIAAMTAFGVLALVLPLFRAGDQTGQRSDITDQLRRLDELSEDLAVGDVDDEVASELKDELERAVYDATQAAATPADTTPMRSLGLPLALAIFVPVLAFTVYFKLGMPDLAGFLAEADDADLKNPEVSVEYMLEEVRARLQAHPDDASGWWVLARTALRRGQIEEAIAAAESLLKIVPEGTAAKLLLVDALLMQSDGRMTAKALALVDEILETTPSNPSALILKGIGLQQRGDLTAAIARWRSALPQLEPGSALRPQLQAMLASAGAADSGNSYEVRVTVSASTAAHQGLPPDTPVFVFARNAEVAGPPLAASRLRLDQLPARVVLNDEMSMVRGRTLSDADSVYLVARIAVNGQPGAAPGNHEARTSQFPPDSPPANLELLIGIADSTRE